MVAVRVAPATPSLTLRVRLVTGRTRSVSDGVVSTPPAGPAGTHEPDGVYPRYSFTAFFNSSSTGFTSVSLSEVNANDFTTLPLFTTTAVM